MNCVVMKKTVTRSNKAQIKYMCQYMADNPRFAAGEFRSPQGARILNEEWLKLKLALDELGPQRSVEQWKICWRDQKLKARKEGASHTGAINTTGNMDNIPNITENTDLILNTIGSEMADGMGVEEAPIGFDAVEPSEALKSRRPIRKKRALPSDSFLKAQLELNDLLRELISEVRRGNDIRERMKTPASN